MKRVLWTLLLILLSNSAEAKFAAALRNNLTAVKGQVASWGSSFNKRSLIRASLSSYTVPVQKATQLGVSVLLCLQLGGCVLSPSNPPQVEAVPALTQDSQAAPPDLESDLESSVSETLLAGRVYWNGIGGLKFEVLEEYTKSKDELPAEFYDKMGVFIEEDGKKYLVIVHAYDKVYPYTGKNGEHADKLVVIDEGRMKHKILSAAEVEEIIVSNHPAYRYDDGNAAYAVLSSMDAIPFNGMKIPQGQEGLYLHTRMQLVLSGEHLVLRVVGVEHQGDFTPIEHEGLIFSRKSDTNIRKPRSEMQKQRKRITNPRQYVASYMTNANQ